MTSPITIDPAQEVHTAIWETLRGDSQINSFVNDVLDSEPDQHNYPTIVVPDPISLPDNTHDSIGRKITFRIHTRARGDVRGRNVRVDNTVGARVVALLEHQHKNLNTLVSGHTVYMIHHEETRQIPNPIDRSVRHRVDRLSVWTTQD